MQSDIKAPEGGRQTVLIVDDDPTVCRIYGTVLKRSGYRVMTAQSFQAAAEMMAGSDFDVLISDIALDENDGLDILARSRQLHPETPVIMVTGLPDVETAAAAVRLNAYEYLSKPVSSEMLVSTVARAVRLKSLRAEKKKAKLENRRYQRDLEQLVAVRTRKLIESDQRYQLLFENSRDAIYMADWQDGFLALNQAAVELFGYPKDALMASRVDSLHTDPQRYLRFREDIQRKGFVKDFAVQLRKENGAIIECLLTAHLLSDVDGRIEGHQGIVRDITAQKRAAEKIRAQNRFLTNVIESLSHPFLVIDADDYSVKVANAAARKFQHGVGETCYALNHGSEAPCSQEGLCCPLEKVRQTRRPVHLVHKHRDTHGREAQHEVHAFPLLDARGEVRQVIEYCIDITEKKRLEAIAEAANLMDNLGYIFSGIRHEIGNPLNSVKMALSVLSMNLDRYPKGTIREFVDRSLSEISRVEYLLKALKNFSMFEVPDVAPVGIGPFMENFKALVEKDFVAKGITVSVNLPGEEVMALTDPRAFHQVLLNLLTNAADALVGRDHPRIDIDVARTADCVVIRVTDNGSGMTETELRNTFRPFHTTKPAGTGLGLVIVKKMLSKMDSGIRIDSTLNAGTTVTMTLPPAGEEGDANA